MLSSFKHLWLNCAVLGFVFVIPALHGQTQAIPGPAVTLAIKPPGIATGPGRYDLYVTDDATERPFLQISRADATESATIHWPAAKNRPATQHDIPLAEDGDKYIIAWERNGGTIWIADKNTLRVINVDDPNQIRTNMFGRNNNGGWGEIPKAVLEELEKVYPIGRKDGTIGGNVGGQTITTAETSEEWKVEGNITNPEGKPLPNAFVTVTTEYKPLEVIAKTTSNTEGHYVVKFRTDLETLAKFRGIKVTAAASGFREKNYNSRCEFAFALHSGERISSKEIRPELIVNQTGSLDFAFVPDVLNTPRSDSR